MVKDVCAHIFRFSTHIVQEPAQQSFAPITFEVATLLFTFAYHSYLMFLSFCGLLTCRCIAVLGTVRID